jgi:hypothetical protein
MVPGAVIKKRGTALHGYRPPEMFERDVDYFFISKMTCESTE